MTADINTRIAADQSARIRAAGISGNPRHGQATVEYALLLGIVAAAVVGMQLYAKRGIAAGIKMAADQLSPFPPADDPVGELAQALGMAHEASMKEDEPINPDVDKGTFLVKLSATRAEVDQRVNTVTGDGGSVQRTILADQTTTTGALEGVEGLEGIGPGVSYFSLVAADDAQR